MIRRCSGDNVSIAYKHEKNFTAENTEKYKSWIKEKKERNLENPASRFSLRPLGKYFDITPFRCRPLPKAGLAA